MNDVASSKETGQRAFRIELLTPKARMLSVLSLGGLAGWFVCKLVFPLSEQPLSQLLVGVLALVGFISSIVVGLTGHAYLANAPEKQLDERELAQRNAAYMRA
jgi:hypothetical protein